MHARRDRVAQAAVSCARVAAVDRRPVTTARCSRPACPSRSRRRSRAPQSARARRVRSRMRYAWSTACGRRVLTRRRSALPAPARRAPAPAGLSGVASAAPAPGSGRRITVVAALDAESAFSRRQVAAGVDADPVRARSHVRERQRRVAAVEPSSETSAGTAGVVRTSIVPARCGRSAELDADLGLRDQDRQHQQQREHADDHGPQIDGAARRLECRTCRSLRGLCGRGRPDGVPPRPSRTR